MYDLQRFAAAAPLPIPAAVEVGDTVSITSLSVLQEQYGVADWALLNAEYGNDVETLHKRHLEVGHRVDDGPYKDNRSGARYAFLVECGLKGVPTSLAMGILLDRRFGISAAVMERADAVRYAEKEVRDAYGDAAARPRASGDTAIEARILNKHDWLESARKFVAQKMPNVLAYNGDWLDYANGAYSDIEDATIKSRARMFLDASKVRVGADDEPKIVPFNPSSHEVDELLSALKDLTHVSREALAPPCWLPEYTGESPSPIECISLRNGILHLPTGKLLDPTPKFFTRNSLNFEYDPGAAVPKVWNQTISDIWQEDPSCISLLQEIMGYLLVPDTSRQKIFLILGPTRSGKGMIGRTVKQLVGATNVTSPALGSLGKEFGLEPLLGKQLAIVSDLKLGKSSDPVAISGDLLRISGEDSVSVPRKYKTAWEGKLDVRFLILSNSTPRFPDNASAVANRFVILPMTKTYLGRENYQLDEKIAAELPGILNWAIEGWRRLQKNGRFSETESGGEQRRKMIRGNAPVEAFVQDECVVEATAKIDKDTLHEAYVKWCEYNRQGYHMNKEQFGEALLDSQMGRVRGGRPIKDNADRKRFYMGIRLNEQNGERPQPSQSTIPF